MFQSPKRGLKWHRVSQRESALRLRWFSKESLVHVWTWTRLEYCVWGLAMDLLLYTDRVLSLKLSFPFPPTCPFTVRVTRMTAVDVMFTHILGAMDVEINREAKDFSGDMQQWPKATGINRPPFFISGAWVWPMDPLCYLDRVLPPKFLSVPPRSSCVVLQQKISIHPKRIFVKTNSYLKIMLLLSLALCQM